MKILFLGTGAADWPLKRTPEYREFRRLSSVLIDGTLLIDPGPSVPDALAEYQIDPSSIRWMLNTHPHSDHFCRETVDTLTAAGAELITLKPGELVSLGKHTVHALTGNHPTAPYCTHFLIGDGKSTLFYGLDGAWLTLEEVLALREAKVDLAILDGTVGEQDAEGALRIFTHNNYRMVEELEATIRPFVKQIMISHLARTLHGTHDEVVRRMAPREIGVAFDGMEVEC